MKINPILTICALLIGAVIFYAYYAAQAGLERSLIGGITASFYLISFLALDIPSRSRNVVLLRVISASLFLVTALANMIFTWLGFQLPITIIVNALAFIGWLLVLYGAMPSAKNEQS